MFQEMTWEEYCIIAAVVVAVLLIGIASGRLELSVTFNPVRVRVRVRRPEIKITTGPERHQGDVQLTSLINPKHQFGGTRTYNDSSLDSSYESAADETPQIVRTPMPKLQTIIEGTSVV